MQCFSALCWVCPVWWRCRESTSGVMACFFLLNSCILTSLYFLIELALNLTSVELSPNFATIVEVISRAKFLSCLPFLVSKNRPGICPRSCWYVCFKDTGGYIAILFVLCRLVKIMPFCLISTSAVQVKSRIGWLLQFTLHCMGKKLRDFSSFRCGNSSSRFWLPRTWRATS